MSKTYIGDSVYAEYDGYSITLTTENGMPTDPNNTIVLEPLVLDNLLHYIESLKEQSDAEPERSND